MTRRSRAREVALQLLFQRDHNPGVDRPAIERFVRPVRWLLCLLGPDIVPLTFGGKTAASLTFGHRVLHGDAPISIAEPSAYQAALESAHVLPDVEARRHRIRKALDAVCKAIPHAAGSDRNRITERWKLLRSCAPGSRLLMSTAYCTAT